MSVPAASSLRHRLVRWAAYGLYYALLTAFLVEVVAWASQLRRLLKPLELKPLSGFLVSLELPLLLLGLAWAGALLVHEGGHWLGSQAVGFRCYAVVAGWLRLERQATSWKLRLTRWPKNMGGYVQALPDDYTRFRQRQALFVAAGPAASLLAGLLALVVALPYWDGPSAGGRLLPQLLMQEVLGFGGVSLFTGLGNLLPFKPRTDGSHLLAMLQNGLAWQRHVALTRLTSAMRGQQRPRHWPAAELEPLLAYTDQSASDCVAHYLAYAYAIDQPVPDTVVVRHHLQQAVNRRQLAGKEIERALYAEAAYCAALLTQESDKARHWLKRVAEVAPLTDKDAFVQAVVAFSSGEYERAQLLLHQSRAQVADMPASDVRTQSEERLASVQAYLTQRLAANVANRVAAPVES